MGDLIDRDSVIKATCDYCDRQGHCDEICAEVELIKEVPSVQPTHKTPSNTLGTLDCISRQEAIEAIEKMQMPIMRSEDIGEQFVFRGMSEALNGIKELPSVQPRKGKWIGYNADDKAWQRDDGTPIFMDCSECHGFVINNTASSWNFCPNCGADMREGGQDE